MSARQPQLLRDVQIPDTGLRSFLRMHLIIHHLFVSLYYLTLFHPLSPSLLKGLGRQWERVYRQIGLTF